MTIPAAEVLIFGDINVDALARLEASLQPGADNLLPGFELQLGGVGANTAVAFAKWGVAARLLGYLVRVNAPQLSRKLATGRDSDD